MQAPLENLPQALQYSHRTGLHRLDKTFYFALWQDTSPRYGRSRS